MSRYHPYIKTKHKPGYIGLLGRGIVPSGTRAPQAQTRSGGYHGNDDGSCSDRDNKHHYRSSVRRPSPVPDRRSAMRQSQMSNVRVRLRSGECAISRPEYVRPDQQKVQKPEAELRRKEGRLQTKRGDADGSNFPSRGRPVSDEQDYTQMRSNSSGMFVRQDSPPSGPSGSSVHGEDDEEYEEDAENNNEDRNEYDSLSEGDVLRASTPASDSLEEDNSGVCQCPISLSCSIRSNHLIDCRTLVLEWRDRAWTDRAAREEIDMEIIPKVAEFVTVARIRDVLRYCAFFKSQPPGEAGHRGNFWSLVVCAAEVRYKSITQEVLDSTQVLVQLQEFLVNPLNPQEHLQKGTPENIKEDISYIYNKWSRGDLLGDANRGLRLVATTNAKGTPVARLRIDTNWAHRMRDTFYGHGHLINGQRWMSRIEMSRDGAHGPLVAGITGSIEHGARSVVMGYHDERKENYYADVDKRDTIYYMGTALPPKNEIDQEPTNIKDTTSARNRNSLKPTKHTRMLLKSIETQRPVRVFRSHMLAKIVKHKPVEGYRYDGLYRVVKAKLLKKDRQIYQFTMRRLQGQGPLRGVTSARRPDA